MRNISKASNLEKLRALEQICKFFRDRPVIQSARGSTCKDKSRHNLHQAKSNNNSDIVTVSSASIDTCNVPQPLQKMRDNNYQIQ